MLGATRPPSSALLQLRLPPCCSSSPLDTYGMCSKDVGVGASIVDGTRLCPPMSTSSFRLLTQPSPWWLLLLPQAVDQAKGMAGGAASFAADKARAAADMVDPRSPGEQVSVVVVVWVGFVCMWTRSIDARGCHGLTDGWPGVRDGCRRATNSSRLPASHPPPTDRQRIALAMLQRR